MNAPIHDDENSADFDLSANPLSHLAFLKSCPFCGGEAELLSHRTWDTPRRWQWSVRCNSCKAYTTRKAGLQAKETVIELWNKRT